MSNTRKKGNDTERKAEGLYEAAGFRTERSVGQRWDRTDWFGLFDIMAIQPSANVHMTQVKSNRAAGVQEFMERATALCPPIVTLDFLVRHDGGPGGNPPPKWRLMRPKDPDGYTTVVDERKLDAEKGEAVIAFLQEEVSDG